MNIIFSSDDNYAPFLGIAIYSLLKSNQENENSYDDKIIIYIMDMNISQINKDKLNKTIEGFNCVINFINTSKIDVFLKKEIIHEVSSLAKYYRLFLPTLLPKEVNKVIYFDCDGLILSTLKELWETDISEYDIGGVLDIVSPKAKLEININPHDDYVNSGMLLINLGRWREKNLEIKMIDYIIATKGQKFHFNDQRVINKICLDKKILSPKFNVLTPFYVMNVKQLKKYHNIVSKYYTQEEINYAIKNPVFCHLTPYLTDRPWVEGNSHPLKKIYLEFQKETYWANVQRKNNGKQLKPWLKTAFKFLPNDVFIKIVQLIANKN